MHGLQPMAARFRLDDLLKNAKPEPLTQSALARLCGVSLVTINAIANNRTRQVKLDTLDKIADALGVQPGALIEREEDEPKKRKR